jgi:hypothetical protein
MKPALKASARVMKNLNLISTLLGCHLSLESQPIISRADGFDNADGQRVDHVTHGLNDFRARVVVQGSDPDLSPTARCYQATCE